MRHPLLPMRIRHPSTPDRRPLRLAIALPFIAFAATLLAAVALAALNAHAGSLLMAPGEHLLLPAALAIALYAWGLHRMLLAAGAGAPVHRKARRVMVAVSTLLASPVLALLVMPAINGLGAWGPAQQSLLSVERVESTPVSRSRQRHYYAHVAQAEPAEHGLRPGRYFVGTYARAWAPVAATEASFAQVQVQHRVGLLGARTLLEVLPAP